MEVGRARHHAVTCPIAEWAKHNTEQGAELLLELAKTADVLATKIRPAVMARLGLGYARLNEVNPRLIYASMVGFSQKGPYGPKAAYDDMMQAATGRPRYSRAMTFSSSRTFSSSHSAACCSQMRANFL